ncbi:MAG: RtcB family protein [Coriobacteriales bacterium]|nr:RtcB family protein [Coriobacteriales bacterium]
MYTTIDTESIPIYVWGEPPDEQAMAQTRHLANLPFAHHHVAMMADAHVGYGMPIGGVLAAIGHVIPHAVGLDIGCGVRTWCTNVPLKEMLDVRDRILNDIQRSVPQGHEWHRASQAGRTDLFGEVPDVPALVQEIERAERQVGTLGSGNHFIELQVDTDDIVWAMVHSGSRNLGKQMGSHYNAVAKEENVRTGSDVPIEWGLAHLAIDSEKGAEYLEVMDFCLRFARENRRFMAEEIQRAITRHFPGIEPTEAFDVHHNYASIEHHYGADVVIHRKGAVRARGLVAVPGSMGTASYVGIGLASPESFESCSHGAGRVMGRGEAKRRLSVEHVITELKERDVRLFKVKKRDVAEEAPEAYKDIEDVMRWQRDLVEPKVKLRPIGVVKG